MKMKTLAQLAFLTLMASALGLESSSWIYVPDESDEHGDPWRLHFQENGVLVSQSLFAGVRSERIGKYKENENVISCRFSRKDKFVLSVTEVALELIDEDSDRIYNFKRLPEWDKRFDEAPPIPKTKEEAINTLLKLYPANARKEFANSKREDLIRYHFTFGMTIRNAFGLWNKRSPLRKDLGGGHPDDASMVLIEAFWEELKRQEKTEQNASGDELSTSNLSMDTSPNRSQHNMPRRDS